MKKKIAVLTASVLLAAVWTAGCFKSSGNTWDGSENSIYVADDLSVLRICFPANMAAL